MAALLGKIRVPAGGGFFCVVVFTDKFPVLSTASGHLWLVGFNGRGLKPSSLAFKRKGPIHFGVRGLFLWLARTTLKGKT